MKSGVIRNIAGTLTDIVIGFFVEVLPAYFFLAAFIIGITWFFWMIGEPLTAIVKTIFTALFGS